MRSTHILYIDNQNECIRSVDCLTFEIDAIQYTIILQKRDVIMVKKLSISIMQIIQYNRIQYKI